MDDEDCERRRMECIDEMTNLEKQFTDLKDQYVPSSCLYLICAWIYVVYKCIQTFPHWSQSVHNFFSLYKERLSQVDAKLQEVMSGKAPEYLEPLANLQENMQIRTKVAGRSDVQTEHVIIVVWNCAFTQVLFGNKVHCQILH